MKTVVVPEEVDEFVEEPADPELLPVAPLRPRATDPAFALFAVVILVAVPVVAEALEPLATLLVEPLVLVPPLAVEVEDITTMNTLEQLLPENFQIHWKSQSIPPLAIEFPNAMSATQTTGNHVQRPDIKYTQISNNEQSGITGIRHDFMFQKLVEN
ncbi:hypothetical protein GQX74_001378 [Glossina fuscipes]|nr:hypothetical protein GQX74_001378 [Glossina fuscipes]